MTSALKSVVYWLHVGITIGAWIAPFLVSWFIIVPVYMAVQVQYSLFGRCLVNDTHDLVENGEDTIYGDVCDMLNIPINKKKLHFFARNIFYYFLSAVTLIWQLALDNEALWF